MREKRPVTFRMAPKKSKCQISEKEVTMADGWSAEDSGGSFADQLRVVPLKFAEYLAETSRNCVAQALGLVKSFWPSTKIAILGDGMCSTCDHDRFVKYVEEAEPVADHIVKLIEQ